MPTRVDSTRLRRRLKAFLQVLPVAADVSIIEAAEDMVNRVQSSVRSRWANNTQVGFDIDRFINIIGRIEPLTDGVGIFDVTRMGTEDDFESIAHEKGLWHNKTGSAALFGEMYNNPESVGDTLGQLAARRNQRWGDTEPQWWLLEHGTLGTSAYEPMPPNPAINDVILTSMPRVFVTIRDTVTRMLRNRGVLV